MPNADIEMSGDSLRNLEELERIQGRAPGLLRIYRGECPRAAFTSMGCMLCVYGHMTDCHYPQTCREAECSHYKREIEEEG